MSRMKPKALSDPPSQPPLEGGLDNARPLTSNTVASLLIASLRVGAHVADSLARLRVASPSVSGIARDTRCHTQNGTPGRCQSERAGSRRRAGRDAETG